MSSEDTPSKKGEQSPKIIRDEAPTLPQYSELLDLLQILIEEIEESSFQDEHFNFASLKSFYFPFLQFLSEVASECSSSLMNISIWKNLPYEISVALDHSWENDTQFLERYYQLHSPVSAFEKETKWFLEIYLWYLNFEELLTNLVIPYALVLVLHEKSQKDFLTEQELADLKNNIKREEINEILEEKFQKHWKFFQSAPHQWNGFVLILTAQWLHQVLKPEYRKATPPNYVYIHSGEVSHLVARFYRGHNWATGFGQRLIVPSELSPKQVAEMWDNLLITEDIYANEHINHSARKKVFRLITENINQDFVLHLDLAGGKGDFVEYLKEHLPSLRSTVVDISPLAIEHAQKKGIDARVGNAEQHIPAEDESFEVVTINFAVQWLKKGTYAEVLRVLKPGGMCVFNVYPPVREEAMLYVQILETLGFEKVNFFQDNTQGRNDFILTAHKPLLKP